MIIYEHGNNATVIILRIEKSSYRLFPALEMPAIGFVDPVESYR